MEKKELLERYEKGLASEGKNRGLYLRYAQNYLDASDGAFDRDGILKYLENTRRRGKFSDGTVNFIFRVIRTLYNRSSDQLAREGIEWPFRRGETPQIREDKVVAPALDPGIIYEMIEMVKAEGSPDEKVYLALSTTYGMRREEMLDLGKEDVNLKDKTIHVKTLKHGRERTHILPDSIIPQLEGYDFAIRTSEFSLLNVWYRLEWKVDFAHQPKVGWHSIRRTLNTLLLDELPESVVMSFMRWKQRTSSHMPYRYSAQRFVGREASSTRVIGEAKDVDSKVFAVHPFLEHWR